MVDIIHTPFGQEHPYEQLPEERFPRHPRAGEAFTVGVAIRPPGTAASVRVHYRTDTDASRTVEAERISEWKPELEHGVGAEYLERIVRVEQDVWRAQLSAPNAGETLRYWIEAEGVTTPEYIVTGLAWEQGGQVVPCEPRAEGVREMRIVRSAQAGDTVQLEDAPRLLNVEWLTDGTRARRVRLTFEAASDEAFFGLGERFNALDQRGNILDVRVYEQYKDQGKYTYMPIPFMLSSHGYGVFVDSSRWMQFDLAASAPDVWTIEADLGEDESLPLVVFNADDPIAMSAAFARLTGPVALPPLWAFGLWMSGNEWNSQKRVLDEVRQSFEHEITPSVMVIEAWSDETTFYIWNDAQYEAKSGDAFLRYDDFTFPPDGKWYDPKGMVDQLHADGVKLLLWQIPVVKILEQPHAQHEADRAHFEQAGYGVRHSDGSLHLVRPFWFRGGYLWDVTNPAAREWWLNKRAYLLDDIGIDGFKTDGGEHLWGTDVLFHDGRTGAEVWNEYPQRYSEAYYQFANQKRNGDALVFSRAGFVGSQRSPAHWAGDENSTWDAFRHSILAGLSAGISGIPFWGWDIAGFSGEIPSAELYLRGMAMAAFCPIFQYHSEFNAHREPKRDRTPWNIQQRTGDERVIPTFRHFTNVRHNLMPYIWQEARHSAQTGEPMMRALRLYIPDASPYHYFFGRDLLVCPVVDEGATRVQVTLPPGDWYDLWTGRRYSGKLEIDVPLDRIAVFVRAGSSIPVRFEGGTWGARVALSGEADKVLRFGL